MQIGKGEVVIMGDFNEVRNKCERFGSVFNSQGADVAGLVEVPLGGCSFTWCHKSTTKMSKLDRVLISDSLMCPCPNISSTSLDRYLSDHRPILMREVSYDYGPVPFRFFHYWFEIEGFDKLVEDSWKEAPETHSNAYLKMMKKLRYLKDRIRVWSRLNKESLNRRKRSLKSKLVDLDLIIDKGAGEDTDVNRRHEVVRFLSRSQLAIRGVLVDGVWMESPILVKSEFLSHFKKRFDQPQENRLRMEMDFPNRINSDQKEDLEREISKEEIKRAVWDCGYEIVGLIKLLVDFEKAYDSVRWDFVDDILKKFGFGEKWCSLHVSFQRVVDASMFKGIVLALSLHLSHMFYVDGVIFMGQWSESNLDIIVHVLNCFHRASGLRINMAKSKLMGISVDAVKVEQAAAKIGCVTLKTPFINLGACVGGLMSQLQS
ncbi:RNA-directed DNA polymerase, eukaryota, reverse transcriptase zinc-binding domain protein [Tanacetum coccineum]